MTNYEHICTNSVNGKCASGLPGGSPGDSGRPDVGSVHNDGNSNVGLEWTLI